MQNKFLIINFGNKLDTIFSTVLVDNIHSSYSDSTIDFMVFEENSTILKNNQKINNVIEIKRGDFEKNSTLWDILLGYKLRKNSYKTIFMLSQIDRNEKIAIFCGAQNIIAPQPNKTIWSRLNPLTDTYELIESKHAVETYLDCIRAIGLKVGFKRTSMAFSDKSNLKVTEKLQKYEVRNFVHIHLTSNDTSANANPELISKIIDYIELQKNIKTVITSSSDSFENHRLFEALSNIKSKPTIFAGSLSDEDMICLSSKAVLFIGTNTPILHTASSQNIPTIALFAQDSAKICGTWNNIDQNGSYITKAAIQENGIHTILQPTRDCVPCMQNGCENSGISECINDISFEAIKTQIDKKLA